MFTGLIAELGTVRSLSREGESYHLTISAPRTAETLNIGDSIAVNGACLTVVQKSATGFTADVMPETVRLTNLGSLRGGEQVNLERTLRLCDGLDGHLVSGHVEGQGTILSRQPDGIAVKLSVAADKHLLRYILPKGSIAIDGISLTVTQVGDGSFSVGLIPHTARMTTLGFKQAGEKVNLETDIIGKYVERFLQLQEKAAPERLLDKKTLLENGFL